MRFTHLSQDHYSSQAKTQSPKPKIDFTLPASAKQKFIPFHAPFPATTSFRKEGKAIITAMANKLYRLVTTLDRPQLSIAISQRIRCLSGESHPAAPPQETSRSEKEGKEKVELNPKEESSGDGEGGNGVYVNKVTGEVGGPRGPEPTRYGDWEKKGRCSDF